MGWPPTLWFLMIPFSLIGLAAARELAKEEKLKVIDKILVLPGFVYLLNWLISRFAGQGPLYSLLFVMISLMACTLIVLALDHTQVKEKDIKPITEELGKYPIYLSEDHYITTEQTFEHVQIIGKSGSGKTKSYFKNAVLQVMKQGLGLFLVDPKSEEVGDLTYYAQLAGREKDYYCFDLLRPEISPKMNPLYRFQEDHSGKMVPASQEVSEVVFGSLFFEEAMSQTDGSHYVKMAKTFIENATSLFHKVYPVITYADYYHLITAEVDSFETIERLCELYPDSIEADYFRGYWLNLGVKDRIKNLSGLVSKLSGFVKGPWAPLINCKEPDITMKTIINEKKIFHFGSASLAFPSSYKPITVAFLYDIMGEIGKVGSKIDKMAHPFHLFLDEFHNVAYPGFIDIINKVRSKGMPCHIGHQSMGDLNQKGKAFEDQVIDSTTTKICFRILNDETAQRFGNILGTKDAKILRVKSFKTNVGILNSEQEAGTAEKGIGDREYVHNPDEFKRLQKGEAIGMVTYQGGVSYFKMHFAMAPEAPPSHSYEDVAPRLNNHLRDIEKSLPFEGAIRFVEKSLMENKPAEAPAVLAPVSPQSVLPGPGSGEMKVQDETTIVDMFLKAFSKVRNQAKRKTKKETKVEKVKVEKINSAKVATIIEAPASMPAAAAAGDPPKTDDEFFNEIDRLKKESTENRTPKKKRDLGK